MVSNGNRKLLFWIMGVLATLVMTLFGWLHLNAESDIDNLCSTQKQQGMMIQKLAIDSAVMQTQFKNIDKKLDEIKIQIEKIK